MRLRGELSGSGGGIYPAFATQSRRLNPKARLTTRQLSGSPAPVRRIVRLCPDKVTGFGYQAGALQGEERR